MTELARWDPFRSVAPFNDDVFDMVPSLFRSFSRAVGADPRMDVGETETAYHMAIELPGVPKEAIQVSVMGNSVTLTAEPASEKSAEEVNWLLRERETGKFTRTITLPEEVNEDASQARYADGVLYLSLQKKRASQIKRLTVH